MSGIPLWATWRGNPEPPARGHFLPHQRETEHHRPQPKDFGGPASNRHYARHWRADLGEWLPCSLRDNHDGPCRIV